MLLALCISIGAALAYMIIWIIGDAISDGFGIAEAFRTFFRNGRDIDILIGAPLIFLVLISVFAFNSHSMTSYPAGSYVVEYVRTEKGIAVPDYEDPDELVLVDDIVIRDTGGDAILDVEVQRPSLLSRDWMPWKMRWTHLTLSVPRSDGLVADEYAR